MGKLKSDSIKIFPYSNARDSHDDTYSNKLAYINFVKLLKNFTDKSYFVVSGSVEYGTINNSTGWKVTNESPLVLCMDGHIVEIAENTMLITSNNNKSSVSLYWTEPADGVYDVSITVQDGVTSVFSPLVIDGVPASSTNFPEIELVVEGVFNEKSKIKYLNNSLNGGSVDIGFGGIDGKR